MFRTTAWVVVLLTGLFTVAPQAVADEWDTSRTTLARQVARLTAELEQAQKEAREAKAELVEEQTRVSQLQTEAARLRQDLAVATIEAKLRVSDAQRRVRDIDARTKQEKARLDMARYHWARWAYDLEERIDDAVALLRDMPGDAPERVTATLLPEVGTDSPHAAVFPNEGPRATWVSRRLRSALSLDVWAMQSKQSVRDVIKHLPGMLGVSIHEHLDSYKADTKSALKIGSRKLGDLLDGFVRKGLTSRVIGDVWIVAPVKTFANHDQRKANALDSMYGKRLELNRGTLAETLAAFEKASGLKVEIPASIRSSISFEEHESDIRALPATPAVFLDLLLLGSDLRWTWDGKVVRIARAE